VVPAAGGGAHPPERPADAVPLLEEALRAGRPEAAVKQRLIDALRDAEQYDRAASTFSMAQRRPGERRVASFSLDRPSPRAVAWMTPWRSQRPPAAHGQPRSIQDFVASRLAAAGVHDECVSYLESLGGRIARSDAVRS